MGSADKDRGSCKLQCGVLAVLLIVALQTVAVLMIAGVIPGKHDNTHRHTEKVYIGSQHVLCGIKSYEQRLNHRI